jgi:FkbM family methyltransferase
VSPQRGMAKLRCLGRKITREAFGSELLHRSSLLQRLLAFQANGETVTDLNLRFPVEYHKNSVLGNLLFYDGSFEEVEVSYVLEVLRDIRAPVVLDIGANVGWHALNWAISRPDIQVYAFEPSPTSARLLVSNAARNGVDRQVKHLALCVANRVGIAEFYECEDSGYSSLKDTKRKKVVSKTEVSVTTVDRFVETTGLSKLDVIKIDVEGFETDVVRGACKTLERFSPDLLVEIYGGEASNPCPEETLSLLQSLQYSAYVWKNGELVQYQSHSDKHFNYFLSKKPRPRGRA